MDIIDLENISIEGYNIFFFFENKKKRKLNKNRSYRWYTAKTTNLTKSICLISSKNIITLNIRHNHQTSNISVRYKDLFLDNAS